MCGIAGIVSLSRKIVEADLEQFLPFLKERGPDSHGIWIDDNIGLFHSRLKIIDLSDEANQPMIRDNIVLVFNGEIYNFLSLKKHPDLQNFDFQTGSDTEVILAGYIIWGIDRLLSEINGMFAFAIYDGNKEIIHLVRDRFGKKPLYYFQSEDCLAFSSDIRSLQTQGPLTLNLDAVDYFLSELTMPQPHTIWNEVHQVKPGSFLTIGKNSLRKKEQTYWQLKTSIVDLTLNEALEETEQLLKKAILRRVISDVPLGSFLSGGIDSGLIVSILASNSTERIKTYSVGIDGLIEDELGGARKVAKKYNTDHHEIHMSQSLIYDTVDDIIEYVGEPFADSSLIPSFFISKEIKKYATVALSGDGGDELFGGYDQYLTAYKSSKLIEKYPNERVRNVAVMADKVQSRFSRRENLGSYLHFYSLNPPEKLYRNVGFTKSHKDQLLKNVKTDFTNNYLNQIWSNNISEKLVDQIMMSSVKTRLLNDYLVKIDRSSMKNSLEIRSPFMDKDLAEFAFTIPSELKFKGGISKYILRKLAQKYIGSESISSPKKGFGIPISLWINDRLKSDVEDRLYSLSKRGLFDQDQVQRLWLKHQKNASEAYRIWALYCLEVWFDKYLNRFSI